MEPNNPLGTESNVKKDTKRQEQGLSHQQHLKPVNTLLQVDKNRCALLELDERSGGVFGGAENRFCSKSCRWSRFLVGLPSRLG